jgi:hypothetical protein
MLSKMKHMRLGVSFTSKVKKEIMNAIFLIRCARSNRVHPIKYHPLSIVLCPATVTHKKKLMGFTLLHTLSTRSVGNPMALITVINHLSLSVTSTCILNVSITTTL